MTLSKRLQRLCADRNWSQAELARALGISRSHAHQLVHGGRQPSIALSAQLAPLLGVSIGTLAEERAKSCA